MPDNKQEDQYKPHDKDIITITLPDGIWHCVVCGPFISEDFAQKEYFRLLKKPSGSYNVFASELPFTTGKSLTHSELKTNMVDEVSPQYIKDHVLTVVSSAHERSMKNEKEKKDREAIGPRPDKPPRDMHTFITTASGLKFELSKPLEQEIRILDLSVHLSREPRFLGATKFPYSVAQHSITCFALYLEYMAVSLVSFNGGWNLSYSEAIGKISKVKNEVIPEEQITVLLHLLLHDAHETYLKDIPTPIANLIGYTRIKSIKNSIDEAIYLKYNLHPTPSSEDIVELVDKCLFKTERRLLLPENRDRDEADAHFEKVMKYYSHPEERHCKLAKRIDSLNDIMECEDEEKLAMTFRLLIYELDNKFPKEADKREVTIGQLIDILERGPILYA